ncbi:MAG: DUF6873 family GME fold protein [Bacteroidota bacterium]
MLIIVDKKIPVEAKNNLEAYGQLMELETSGITYEAISGHPDIFFHQAAKQVIVAPNLPETYKQQLKEAGIDFVSGEQDVGDKYPASCAYNAVSTKSFLIHNFRNTDAIITSTLEDADLIHVDQGYTRCNLLALDDDHFISSDAGIGRVLERFEKECLYVSPEAIQLDGFKHGFFGGCCGVFNKKVFILGSLKHHPDGNRIKEYLEAKECNIIELFDGPLFDGGSILILD